MILGLHHRKARARGTPLCAVLPAVSVASRGFLHGVHLALRPMRVFVASLLFLVSSASAQTIEEKPIRIGAIYGLTGFANVWSSQARRGIELARDEINAGGGINGRDLEIIFEDSGTTPQGAVTAFNKLVKADHVDAVVGDIISFQGCSFLAESGTRLRVVHDLGRGGEWIQ